MPVLTGVPEITVWPLCHRLSDCEASSTLTNVYPKLDLSPLSIASISVCQTVGPGTPSSSRSWSFSNAISAPLVTVPNAPGCQKPLSADGVLLYFQLKLPAGGLTAAWS